MGEPSATPADFTIADLYPELGELGRLEADRNLRRYVAVVARIYERIRSDPVAYQQLKALTASHKGSRIRIDSR